MIWRRKYDRIQINRKQFRIEFNWNALTSFMEVCGMTFDQLDKFDKLNPTQFISLIYEGLIEGSRMEGKIFPYSKEDFAAMLSPEDVAGISLIFQAQNMKSVKDFKNT